MANKKGNNTNKKANNDEIIVRIIICVIFVVVLLTAAFRLGTVGIILNNFLRYIFGELALVTILSGIFLAIYFAFFEKKKKLGWKVIGAIIIANVAILLLFALIRTNGTGTAVFDEYFKMDPKLLSSNDVNYGGGLVGVFIYAGISALLGKAGSVILVIALVVISLVLVIPLDFYGKALNKAKIAKSNADLRKEERKILKEEKRQIKEEAKNSKNNDSYLDVLDQEEIKNYEITDKTRSAFLDIDVAYNERKENTEVKVEPSLNTNDEKPLKRVSNFASYKLPTINIFEDYTNSKISNINKTSAEVKGKKVIEILHNFGIEASLIATHIGPSVTKFEIKPESGVKVSRIQNIQDNIKMELAARDIRIEAPIPGRSAVGIEIPNVEPVAVRMRELVRTSNVDKDKKLLFYLGKDLMGKSVTCEIDKMPHLLIAGATGSGKSVCINAIITSLIYRTMPDEVKLVLVDPKKVEFTPYHDIPHLLWPVITDATMASNMLKKVVVMMEERFDIFSEVGVRNIAGYNQLVDDFNKTNEDPDKAMHRLPFIVVIIDELADLMMVAGKEVEASIQRITQLARASGIHLIVATQRPSTDVITGIIKSNIPSRISFSVASSIDSRTILDQTGAERLLGNGDMLYFPQGEPTPIRLQGVYVTDKEVKDITSFTKKQAKPEYDDAYFEFLNLNNQGGSVSGSKGERDSLYDEVKEFVIDQQKASTSLLQRNFGIGYNRAASLIDSLEENGIIGPANGSKPREVYIKKDPTDE